MHDVYAYGMIAPSTLLELEDDYPPPAGYAELAEVHPSIGGEAAGTAIVLARLGVATKLTGVRLGRDEHSARTIDVLEAAGVDCSAIRTDGDRPPVTEIVVTSGESRTVFGTYRRFSTDRAWEAPSRADVERSRIVCVDPFFEGDSLQVVRWCEDGGVPYVTIDAPPTSEIARLAEVLIISEEFATRTIGGQPRDLLDAYTAQCRGLVVVTQGAKRFLSGRSGQPPQEHSTFSVPVRDTTGAGDSFRAGIIYGMLRGLDTLQLMQTATAVAALVCQRVPGVVNSPTEWELESFLERNG
ncbi:MAG TPA: carbohydrate kinase family protein [Acidimicrobiia bacterium]|nr:carbohydrate kinase family protein [Acidimicrobiia bacterium]